MLKVSMLGFEAVSVGYGKSNVHAMSESEDTALREVVIIGYGTRKD
jgi:hypothetical protein